MTGVDISSRMIDHARRRQAASPDTIEYVVSDAAEIASRFPAGSFDVATSCMTLQDMPDVPAVFTLKAFREPRPSAEALRERPDLEDAAKVPYYVIFDLLRP
ncbi:MAG: class I SAM-dependent methyltransferase [Gemmatimonadota bacterium]|nr:class I SAM-dependent methyltransferase [Gemmatimonadota bacterium]